MNYLVDTEYLTWPLENKLAIVTQDRDFQRVRTFVDIRLL